MNEATIIEWLLRVRPIGVALVIGFVPALIARWKQRPIAPWYIYGFICALLAWPAVALPAIHALLVCPHGKPERTSEQRRRANALALLKEESVRSYPSWIAEMRRKSPVGIERRRYAFEHLGPGEALALVRERAEPSDKHAVSYRHRDVHLGYVPRRHRWIADAIDDGLSLLAIVETVKIGWIFRGRATFVGTRIIILTGGR
jgi:HIRAN domain-containing protein